jgi:hypothetical protein
MRLQQANKWLNDDDEYYVKNNHQASLNWITVQ